MSRYKPVPADSPPRTLRAILPIDPSMFSSDQLARFWSKVERSPNCWLWAGKTSPTGYGKFNLGRVQYNAHRLAFVLSGKTIPRGNVLDHLCRNPGCVNPNHLEAVTQLENSKRGRAGQVVIERSARITHCPYGHEYTPENTHVRRGSRHCRECSRIRDRIRYWSDEVYRARPR